MFMLGDRKKMVAGILGPDPKEREEEAPLSDFEMIGQDLASAIEAKDGVAIIEALKAFHYAHHAEMDLEG